MTFHLTVPWQWIITGKAPKYSMISLASSKWKCLQLIKNLSPTDRDELFILSNRLHESVTSRLCSSQLVFLSVTVNNLVWYVNLKTEIRFLTGLSDYFNPKIDMMANKIIKIFILFAATVGVLCDEKSIFGKLRHLIFRVCEGKRGKLLIWLKLS